AESYRSMMTSPRGCEQQISRLPSAGGSTGSGEYVTEPDSSPLSQLWHTPVRHDQRVGTLHASASSSRLAYRGSQLVAIPLRTKETDGPVPGAPSGRCGARAGAETTPGVSDGPVRKISARMRPRSTPNAPSAALPSSMKPVGPHR